MIYNVLYKAHYCSTRLGVIPFKFCIVDGQDLFCSLHLRTHMQYIHVIGQPIAVCIINGRSIISHLMMQNHLIYSVASTSMIILLA